MRRILVALLATMFLVTATAWAADPLLGPHDVSNQGCASCHAPHNAQAGKGLYLWAMEIPTKAYSTYLTNTGQGGTLTPDVAAMQAGSNTMGGTILCLSCHDTSFSGDSIANKWQPVVTNGTFRGTSGPNTSGAAGYTTYYVNGTVKTDGTYGGASGFSYILGTTVNGVTTWAPSTAATNGAVYGANFAVGTNGDLTHDHPVHVQYPTSDHTYWNITFTNPTISLTGVNFQESTYAYGHPAWLFSSDGATAWVECASCHNPHSQTLTVQKINGTAKKVGTLHFLRGAYLTGDDQTNFCMSCHAMPADAWTGSN